MPTLEKNFGTKTQTSIYSAKPADGGLGARRHAANPPTKNGKGIEILRDYLAHRLWARPSHPAQVLDKDISSFRAVTILSTASRC